MPRRESESPEDGCRVESLVRLQIDGAERESESPEEERRFE